MPVTNGEVVGLALIRDLSEESARDLRLLGDQLYNDTIDEDADDVSMAAFYMNLANDYIDRILKRHDRPKEKKKKPSTDLVLVKNGNEYMPEENSEPVSLEAALDALQLESKDITEMSVKEIGDGTVIFDPDGVAWVATMWTDTVMDLKQGNVTKANVKPKDLKGWTFDGKTWGERIEEMVQELREENADYSTGQIIAEITKRERCVGHPIQVIKAVNRVLSAA